MWSISNLTPIDAILTNTLLPELRRQVLSRKLDGEALSRVTVTGRPEGFAYYSFE
jgi:type VI secretion system protein VasG